jgi:hypothetical protein
MKLIDAEIEGLRAIEDGELHIPIASMEAVAAAVVMSSLVTRGLAETVKKDVAGPVFKITEAGRAALANN